jgi:hypothetical protein
MSGRQTLCLLHQFIPSSKEVKGNVHIQMTVVDPPISSNTTRALYSPVIVVEVDPKFTRKLPPFLILQSNMVATNNK